MWLIVGLGNPGSRYEVTAHNLGFDVIRILAQRHGFQFSPSKRIKAEEATGMINGEKVAMLMPTTFMNLSGEAVGPYATYYKIPPENVLVITDDVTIPWGKVRLRPKGTHGGHNGLRSLIQHLHTNDFPRVRVGCAPENWRGSLADYVLAKLTGDALDLAKHMVNISADACEDVLAKGIDKAQNVYNGYDATKG